MITIFLTIFSGQLHRIYLRLPGKGPESFYQETRLIKKDIKIRDLDINYSVVYGACKVIRKKPLFFWNKNPCFIKITKNKYVLNITTESLGGIKIKKKLKYRTYQIRMTSN